MASMFEHYVITLDGTAQQLAAAVGANIPVARLEIQPDGGNGNPVFIGGDNTLSSTIWGVRLETPIATVPPAPWLANEAPIVLADIWVRGTNTEKVHVFIMRLSRP